MKKLLYIGILFLGISSLSAQDLISGGSNSWIFHTPDVNGATKLHIAPKINGTWDWTKEIEFRNNGSVEFLNYLKIPAASATDNNSPGLLFQENDDFLYDGKYLNHYGFGFHSYTGSSISGGINTYVSGYFGIDLFTGGANRLRIDGNGYVGIGTATPGEALHVKKARAAMIIENTNASNWSFLRIKGSGANFWDMGQNGNNTFLEFRPGGTHAAVTFHQNGNVGIGTSNPRGILDVGKYITNEKLGTVFGRHQEGDTSGDGTYLGVKGYNTQNNIYDGKSFAIVHNFYGSTNSSINFFRGGGVTGGFLTFNTGANTEKMRIDNNGNVGIGTTNAASQLDVRTSTGKGLWLNFNDESAVTFFPNNGNSVFHLSHGHDNKLYLSHGGTVGAAKIMTFVNSGNIGIGTTNPGSWKLAVNGKIRAKEVKVETGWSDFVFYEDYQLPTLKEVEQHIKEKGHLKDIPSAAEVEKNGIFLGEMDSKLLQKIEELTLYTIAQDKELKRKEKRLKEQETQLKKQAQKTQELEARLKKLESLLLEKSSKKNK